MTDFYLPRPLQNLEDGWYIAHVVCIDTDVDRTKNRAWSRMDFAGPYANRDEAEAAAAAYAKLTGAPTCVFMVTDAITAVTERTVRWTDEL